MLEKIRNTIEKYSLTASGDGILIGLSGGADSVCLTHALCMLRDELKITLFAAHLNHGLRGEAADSDERFAAELAKSLGMEFISEKQDVRGYAEKNGVSEETAGRELRYAFFERTAEKYGLNKIATAHNLNDNAETVLMNFIRGSGAAGLCGIPPKRGNIIRPLLNVSRGEIEKYCAENGLKYVTDATNAETVYTRNKIRLELIPLIEREFNPEFVKAVTRGAGLIADDLDFIERRAEKTREKISGGEIPLFELEKNHIAVKRRVILGMLKSAGIKNITSEYVESVLKLAQNGRSGASVSLPDGNIARVEYGKLFVGKNEPKTEPFEYKIPIGKKIYITELGIAVKAEISEGKDVFLGDASSKITVRSKREGDYFYPVGMDGKKKLKKYFIDEKIPRSRRSKTGILTIDGETAWVIGMRRDRRFNACGTGIKIEISE